MTPTPHGQVPEALRLAHIFDNPLPPEWPDMVAAAAELRRQHARIAELEAQIAAVGAGGVQALSAGPAVPAGWKAVPVNPTPEMWKAAKSVPDPNPPYPPHYGLVWDAMLAATPTPPAEQQAITPESGAVYAELPTPTASIGIDDAWHEPAMRDFADRTYALRMQAAPKAAPEAFLKSVIALCSHRGYSPANIEAWDKDDKWIADLWRQAESMLAASPTPPAEQQAAQVIIDFSQVGTAGPFPVANGRVSLPDATMQDLARMLRPTYEAEQQAAPKAAPGEQDDHQILAITTAYEQGVGKGHQAYNSGKEIANPYSPAYRCDLAWQYGYKEGKEQAQREAKAAPKQEAQEPVAYVHVPHYTVDGKVRPVVSFEKYQQDYADGIYSTRIPLYTAPQPAPAPLSEMPYEKRKAIQEGEQISASDAWFHARHNMLDTLDRRNVFRAGFDRGWNAAIAAQGGKT